MKPLILFWLGAFLFNYPLLALDNQFLFKHFNDRQGLKNNIVFSLLKDSKGILWIGTQNGLNRFDGSHFYNYIRSASTNTLPNNSINCLTEDNKGNIWGGTEKGIFKYTPSTNNFVSFPMPASAKSANISNIKGDQQGNVFATTTNEVVKLNSTTNQFEIICNPNRTNKEIGWFYFGKNGMAIDETNHGLWMATGIGLLFYDYKQQTLTGSWNSTGNTLFAKHILTAITISPFNTIWFCDNTNHTLVCFDPNTRAIKDTIRIPNSITKYGATILEDNAHRLWFSNWNYKVLLIDRNQNNNAIQLQNQSGGSNSFSSDFFWASISDKNGTVWLGTPNGIFMCNPNQQVYNPARLPQKIPILDTCPIYQIVEDPRNKSWWVSTNTEWLINYFPKTEKYSIYSLQPNSLNQVGQLPNNCNSIRFYQNDVFINTDQGTWKIDETRKKLTPINLLPQEYKHFIVSNFIVANDTLLFLTDGKKLLSYNPIQKKGTWESMKPIPDSIRRNLTFNKMYWHKQYGFYATGCTDYITHVNNKHQVEVINLIQNESLEKGGYFHESDMDAEGKLWIINKGIGIYCYDAKTKQRKFWNDTDGLMDNHLHAIKADGDGNVWMSYFNMFSVFNPTQNSFTHFSIPYSENNTNYFNILTLRSDGIIMGNVSNDVFEFNPKNLKCEPLKSTPQLSLVKISGKDYFPDLMHELTLEPNQNSILFKFGILLNTSAYPHEFEYLLEGSDKTWVKSSFSNEANYNNLSSGEYTFRVRAKGRNNTWVSNEKHLKIIIKTPFYKSKWFLALLLFSSASLIFYLYRYRLQQKEAVFNLENRAQALEKERAMVSYENLKQQLNPHFLFNSLTSLSGLIASNQEMAGEFLEQMSGIYRYILQHGDQETVLLKNELEFVELYIRLQQTRFKKGLTIDVNIPHEYLAKNIAPVTLQNMIENAIKHNIIDAESPLHIKIYIDEDYIVVENNLQKKSKVETSNKQGLKKFESLYQYLSTKSIVIIENETHFKIKIPLI